MKNSTRLFIGAALLTGSLTMQAAPKADLLGAPILGGLFYQWETETTLIANQYYTFDVAETIEFKQMSTDLSFANPNSASFLGDVVYLFNMGSYTILNPVTGEVIEENTPFMIGEEAVNPIVNSSTYDPGTGKFYMIYWAVDGSWAKALLSFDPDTREIVEIGHLSDPGFPLSMAIAPDGYLYSIKSGFNSLMKIDKETAECTEVGTQIIPTYFSNAGGHAVCSAVTADSKMYTVGNTDSGKTMLVCTDIATGEGEIVAWMPDKERFMGLYVYGYQDPGNDTRVSEINSTSCTIRTERGLISAEGFGDTRIDVLSLDGRTVATSVSSIEANVPAGVYIVRAGNRSFKTIVK